MLLYYLDKNIKYYVYISKRDGMIMIGDDIPLMHFPYIFQTKRKRRTLSAAPFEPNFEDNTKNMKNIIA